ncbi:MAG: hypothetical protein MUC64_00015 [Rubritepida sp.]|nr:hypothetical protein [Rubritepida sp.]
MKPLALVLGALLSLPAPAPAQTARSEAARSEAAQAQPPRAEPAARARPSNPRDRAFMDGGMVGMPGASATPAPSDLAPRPNLQLEGPRAAQVAPTATLSPTLINPRLPGRGVAEEGSVTQRENRFLETPAAGARLKLPLSW